MARCVKFMHRGACFLSALLLYFFYVNNIHIKDKKGTFSVSEDSYAVLQLIRFHQHLTVQYNAQGKALARWLRLSGDKPLTPQIKYPLLRQMDRVGRSHYTGVFYAGSFRNPYLYLFDFSSTVFSFAGHPCTPEQSAQRFRSCALPDFSFPEKYTAIMLHRTDRSYRPDLQNPLSADARRLLYWCFLLDGPDFPDVCFNRAGPVQWFRLCMRSGLPRCHKFYLIPLCAAHRQVLLLHRSATTEEMMHSLCHIPDNRPAALTPREQQALTLAQQGLPNRAIAASLQIQEGTVKKLLSGVYAKLGIQSRYDLFRLPQE